MAACCLLFKFANIAALYVSASALAIGIEALTIPCASASAAILEEPSPLCYIAASTILFAP